MAKHLMIDLETLGTAVNCPVIAIGAVFFDPDTGKLGAKFDAAIDVADAMRYGRASGDTIKWWLGQSQSARENVTRGTESTCDVFQGFYKFVIDGGDIAGVWGNGASFDISILEVAFPRAIEKPAPWKFWTVRDCRTIKALAEGIISFDEPFVGTAHSAVDDAVHQAKWVSAYWQGLRGRRNDDLLF